MNKSKNRIQKILDMVKLIDESKVSEQEMSSIQGLLEEYNKSLKNTAILDFKPNPKQQSMVDVIQERNIKREGFKYFLYWGGNNAGKTCIGSYIVGLLALGEKACKELGLPYIGEKKDIIVGTEDGTVIKNIDKYLLGENSITRIPPDYIAKNGIKRRDEVLKSITLKNGCLIRFLTYKQDYDSWQSHNPDFLWLDEEPKKPKLFSEIYERTRGPNCEMMMTMTPTGFSQVVADKFIYNTNQEWQDKTVWSLHVRGYLDNPHASADHIGGMSEEEKQRRVEGSFAPPEGMVYHQFRNHHVLPHINPYMSKEIGYDADYYVGIDPGNSHPFAVVFLVKTGEYNELLPNTWYIFKELLFERGKASSFIYAEIERHIGMMGKRPKHIIIDSQARQVGVDLTTMGIRCIPADKYSKGKNGDSNREAGISIINNLFFKSKLFISDKCTELKKQFNRHFYKYGNHQEGKDGAVRKVDDDLLDATRYVISYVEEFHKRKRKGGGKIRKDSYGTTYKVGY